MTSQDDVTVIQPNNCNRNNSFNFEKSWEMFAQSSKPEAYVQNSRQLNWFV